MFTLTNLSSEFLDTSRLFYNKDKRSVGPFEDFRYRQRNPFRSLEREECRHRSSVTLQEAAK